jgi:uncharacterized membrane protein
MKVTAQHIVLAVLVCVCIAGAVTLYNQHVDLEHAQAVTLHASKHNGYNITMNRIAFCADHTANMTEFANCIHSV